MKYYNFIDQLIDLSHNDDDLKSDNEFEVIKHIIDVLEKCADEMSMEFINYIKEPKSEKIKTKALVAIDKILTNVYEAKEKMLYIKNNKTDYGSL